MAPAAASALAPAAAYWQGFAYWRRALNGFNDGASREDLDADLTAAIAAFERAYDDPGLAADAKSGAAASWISRAFLASQADPELDWRPWVERYLPLLRDAHARAPDNPRVAWVLGGQLFFTPPAQGGGQDKALALFRDSLADAAAEQAAAEPCAETLLPRWGLPELLMNLAYFELQRTDPDLGAAEAYARAALALVPHWHYVRDVLLPQVLARRQGISTQAG